MEGDLNAGIDMKHQGHLNADGKLLTLFPCMLTNLFVHLLDR